MGNLVRLEEYKGTMESLEKIVKNLNLEFGTYSFDVVNKYFYCMKTGVRYEPGDHYQYSIHENFECI